MNYYNLPRYTCINIYNLFQCHIIFWRSNGSFGIPNGKKLDIPFRTFQHSHSDARWRFRSSWSATSRKKCPKRLRCHADKIPKKKHGKIHFFLNQKREIHRNPWWKWWLLMIVNINDTGVFMLDDDDDDDVHVLIHFHRFRMI